MTYHKVVPESVWQTEKTSHDLCYITETFIDNHTCTEQGLYSASQQGEELLQESLVSKVRDATNTHQSDLALIWLRRETFCKLKDSE